MRTVKCAKLLSAFVGALFLAACAGVAPLDPSPSDFAVHGIDISRYQGEVDWERAKRGGTEFAFIKATEGGDVADPMFRRNFDAARVAGVQRGPYHFYYWCRSAQEQVWWFVQNVPYDPEALPPVLDLEWHGAPRTCPRKPPKAEVLREIRHWLGEIERLYGKKPIIYTSIDFHAEILEGGFDGYPIWVRSVAAYPARRYDDRRWTFWQYTEEGRVPGIDGDVDRNVFAGSKKEWRRWLTGDIDHREVWRR